MYVHKRFYAIFEEGKFESIFIETVNTVRKTIFGEIYRIQNSNSALSLERYHTILSKLSNSQNVIIGYDLNLDFLKTNNEAFKDLTDKLNTITDLYAPLKQAKIPH